MNYILCVFYNDFFEGRVWLVQGWLWSVISMFFSALTYKQVSTFRMAFLVYNVNHFKLAVCWANNIWHAHLGILTLFTIIYYYSNVLYYTLDHFLKDILEGQHKAWLNLSSTQIVNACDNTAVWHAWNSDIFIRKDLDPYIYIMGLQVASRIMVRITNYECTSTNPLPTLTHS